MIAACPGMAGVGEDDCPSMVEWCVAHPEADERYQKFWEGNQREIGRIQELAEIVFAALYDEKGNWR